RKVVDTTSLISTGNITHVVYTNTVLATAEENSVTTAPTAWPSAPSLGAFDVIVVGSGSAGSTAAIAAARGGASVLLIEKLPFLGGSSTAVLDTFYGFYTPGSRSLRIVDSIPGEVVTGL